MQYKQADQRSKTILIVEMQLTIKEKINHLAKTYLRVIIKAIKKNYTTSKKK